MIFLACPVFCFVVGVSWYEAMAYAKWLSQKNKENYSLPTEAQWEKAARGPDGFTYPWGNEFGKNMCNSSECGLGRTSPVGIFHGDESPYGCMDMVGNVWEWCTDWFSGEYYKKSPVENPQGPSVGSSRVFRGGSWAMTPATAGRPFATTPTPSTAGMSWAFVS